MVISQQKSLARAMSSQLRLHFAASEYRTFLKDRFHQGLFHISKDYWDGSHLLLQVLYKGDVPLDVFLNFYICKIIQEVSFKKNLIL